MQLDDALHEWQLLLGEDYVFSDETIKDRYARSTHEFSTRPAAVLYPENTEQVQQIVRIAAKYKTPLYPISRGNNWGYGDACAVTDNQVIVDLRRMNKIIEVNAELAYAVVEPGVTQQQLYENLRDNNIPLLLDVTGAGPDASIVGNTLERGFGHTPCGDHYHHSAGYEVVLADGRLLRTGFGHFENAQAANIFKTGLGPAIDGLFTQSNFGIVTRMAVWLMPKPKCIEAFVFRCRREEDMAAAVDALRTLRLSGILQSCIHIGNDLRAISARMRYPWERMNGATPLSAEVRAELRKKFGSGAWNGGGGMYGTAESVAAARAAVKAALFGIADVYFFSEKFMKTAKSVLGFIKPFGIGNKVSAQLKTVDSVFDLLKGIPSPDHLAGVGWRSRHEPNGKSNNPLDSKAGCFWISPVLPASGAAARSFVERVTTIFEKYAFEPLITLTFISPRALCCVLTISYDKENAQERQRASDCHKAVFAFCMNEGFVPYRTGIQSMRKLTSENDLFWETTQRIKEALDPKQILAPGRYQPSHFQPVPQYSEKESKQEFADAVAYSD